MADFTLYWPILLRQEGYYADDSDDAGGETWEGIARNDYPAWSGWAIVDSYRPTGGFIDDKHANALLKPDAVLQAKVIQFYKSSQWDVLEADHISNQSIANFMVDWGVNGGLSTPVKHAQIVLGFPAASIDGKMGPHTLAAINGAPGASFFASMIQERIDFYHAIVAHKPSQQKFLKTWLDRTNSFTYTP